MRQKKQSKATTLADIAEARMDARLELLRQVKRCASTDPAGTLALANAFAVLGPP
jgi:hypothetical protein